MKEKISSRAYYVLTENVIPVSAVYFTTHLGNEPKSSGTINTNLFSPSIPYAARNPLVLEIMKHPNFFCYTLYPKAPNSHSALSFHHDRNDPEWDCRGVLERIDPAEDAAAEATAAALAESFIISKLPVACSS
jgi:hypothetical protein